MKTMKLFQLKKNKTDFKKVKIIKSKDAYNVIRKFYFDDIAIYESFFILMLDTANNTIAYAKISQGGIVGTVVDLKIIAKYCIDSLCSGVILAHNHPSGNLKPSQADIQITKKIKDGLNLLEVNTLDHLILTEKSYYSFSDNSEL
jgi:DNA repair protein RadC